MRNARTAAFVLIMLLLVACGGNGETTAAGGDAEPQDAPPSEAMVEPTEAEPTEAEADAEATAATVAVTSSEELGDILVDGEGMTLYLFTPDEQGESTCYDDCEQNWPPLEGPAEAAEGADAALLATVERDDGSMQVTYNGWPLYYFAGDSAAGDVNGQGVGDIWYVVDPAGDAVRETAAGGEGRGY